MTGTDGTPDPIAAGSLADASAIMRHNRLLWSHVNDAFSDRDADRRWQRAEVTWGLFERPESELGALGDMADRDVAELGCGAAFLSASLARAGARPVAVDLSHRQLQTARRNQARTGIHFPLVEADSRRPDASCDRAAGSPSSPTACSRVCACLPMAAWRASDCSARSGTCSASRGLAAGWSTIRATAGGSASCGEPVSSSTRCTSSARRRTPRRRSTTTS
jgi:SAM-dependent methyltransferase